MTKRAKLTMGALAGVLALAVGAGMAIASGGESDEPLRGGAYRRATTAALAHVGEGTVTETEAESDGSSYEVEIRRANGTEVEVELDSGFRVTASDNDDEGDGESDRGD